MGKEGLVGPVYDFGLLPEFDTAVIVVAIYLGQREGLPIDLDRLSGGLLYLRQPHGCVVDEGSTEIVKGGELGIGHSVTSQNLPARASMRTFGLSVRKPYDWIVSTALQVVKARRAGFRSF